ncbi:hypothetical protein [Acidisphaera sp. L21]|uniref:hypothetical protein n=1 Tax=Acidisphaera sp. L21 TaxID=1641851 RepID=UPI00131E0E83|nr:hypothetical protein [Acidisphaera sp. L21]
MPTEDHHGDALLETARLELARAHRGVIAMDASEVRRGVEIALAALRDVPNQGIAASKLTKALEDLDAGSLAEMDALIEEVRTALE